MLSHVGGLTSFLQLHAAADQGLLRFARRPAGRSRARFAGGGGVGDRPVIHLDRPNQQGAGLAGRCQTPGIQEGLVAAITAVESCQSFDVRSVQVRVWNRKNCWNFAPARAMPHIYHYMSHSGFSAGAYARLQTWFPFTMSSASTAGMAGPTMDTSGIKYMRQKTAFGHGSVDIEPPQQLLDAQVKGDWAERAG